MYLCHTPTINTWLCVWQKGAETLKISGIPQKKKLLKPGTEGRTMMDEIVKNIGVYVCTVGSAMLLLIIFGLLVYVAAIVWSKFSGELRKICKAESLIFEYKKHRDEFLLWKSRRENDAG